MSLRSTSSGLMHNTLAELFYPSAKLIWKITFSFFWQRHLYVVTFIIEMWGQGFSRTGVGTCSTFTGCWYCFSMVSLSSLQTRRAPCFQSIWGLLTISQLWPSTTSQDPSREVIKNLIRKDAPQGSLIGNVTIWFTRLLTVPSIRERGQGSMLWDTRLFFETNAELMNESEELKSTRPKNFPETIFELTGNSRALQSWREAAPRYSLGSKGVLRWTTPQGTRCLLTLFLMFPACLTTLLPMLFMPPPLTKISGIVSGNFLPGDPADRSACIVPDSCVVAVLQLLVSHSVLGCSLVVWWEW